MQYDSSSNHLNLIHPTAQSSVEQAMDLKFFLNEFYPAKHVSFVSFLFLLVNLFIIIMEHSYSLPASGIKLQTSGMVSDSLIYFSSNQYIAATGIVNIIYGIVALISIKHRKYFLIQLLSVLFLMSFFASLFILFCLNFVLSVLEYRTEKCGSVCFTAHVIKSAFGLVSACLSFYLFFKIQIQFLNRANKHQRTDIIL